MTTIIKSTTAVCTAWGSDKNARRVTYLTAEERAHIRAGGMVVMDGCPEHRGSTVRRVIEKSGRFYARMMGA